MRWRGCIRTAGRNPAAGATEPRGTSSASSNPCSAMHYVLDAGWPGPSACRPAPTRHIIASSALEPLCAQAHKPSVAPLSMQLPFRARRSSRRGTPCWRDSPSCAWSWQGSFRVRGSSPRQPASSARRAWAPAAASGPGLPMLQIVLVPGPERMPRRVPQLRNRVCIAMIESDEGLDCQPALLCTVQAALRAAFSWSRITTAVPFGGA